jgi:hypothetical protein
MDSRDNRPNPVKGIWTELGIEAAPGFLGNDWGFSKLYKPKQYFTLVERDLAFVTALLPDYPDSRRLSLPVTGIPRA